MPGPAGRALLRLHQRGRPVPPPRRTRVAPNFRWVYSYGGTQDRSLDPAVDRVADVFPDDPAITAAGWSSQDASDLLAVIGPRLVGIPANRIPPYLKRLAGRRFSQWQATVDADRMARRRNGRWHRYLTAKGSAAAQARNRGSWDTQPTQQIQPVEPREEPN